MREVRALKHFPWIALFLLWAAGTTLWLLFVGDQQEHVRSGFQVQLERLGDELLRGRLEGALGPNELPQGIETFAVFGPRGQLLAAWGHDFPDRLEPSPLTDISGGQILGRRSGSVDFVKVLEPLRPRMLPWGDGDNPPRRPAQGPRRTGYLFLRVSDDALENRLQAWSIGAAIGAMAWSGLVAFIGVLWFRARRYQAALGQHRELLQFAEASRTLSHELQNPLAAVLLQTALLKRGSESPQVEVAIIEEEAQRMSALVARVRDFLKDPRGQAESVDLAELVRSLSGRFAVAVVLTTEGETPFFVRFDPLRLRSVVENLLKNAVESCPLPPPTSILSRPRPGWVRLEILDSGPGFTAESLRQARNPFYTTKTKGTGIGLSIVDGFVSAADGRLRLENRPEGGAKVTVDLPEATRGQGE